MPHHALESVETITVIVIITIGSSLLLFDVQVCMNSGKVRLNSGILERRHSNWDQALHHFRRAREIDDTYCEPDYWIGASLLQQGKHVQLGLMVGRALLCLLSVSCKYCQTDAGSNALVLIHLRRLLHGRAKLHQFSKQACKWVL